MVSGRRKGVIYFLFFINTFLTFLGLYSLYKSPYTGLRFLICGEQTCVKEVDRGSPADKGGVKKGNILLSIGGVNLPNFAFNPDPDYIASWADYKLFWVALKKISSVLQIGNPVQFDFKDENSIRKVIIIPSRFPFSKIILRTAPIYIVGWAFMLIAFFILRKKLNEASVVNLIIGSSVCMSLVSLATYTVRDIVYPLLPFRILHVSNYIGSEVASYGFVHFLLVFPKRKKILERFSWIPAALYGVLGLQCILRFTEVVEPTYLTVYLPCSACLTIFLAGTLYNFFTEKDVILKKQIQWVVMGFFVSIGIWLAGTSIPVIFGKPLISEEISLLPAILIPVSFAFAITRYHLMEIENIFDYIIIYTITIFVLFGVELLFLYYVTSYFPGTHLPSVPLSLMSVIIIIFIYMPLRNRVRLAVEKIFKRGTYNIEDEIQNFIILLGSGGENTVLEKFSSFVKKKIGPSGICVVEKEGIVYHDTEQARYAGEIILRNKNLWKSIVDRNRPVFGYELSEFEKFEESLLTAISPGKQNYIIIFLKKWNSTAYSKKDISLLSAITLTLTRIIETEILRAEKKKIEERYKKEKEEIMGELHDGLGSLLTNIVVSSDVAKRILSGKADKVEEIITKIGEYSREAIEFMRTGLCVLENPHGELREVISNLRYKLGNFLENLGIKMDFQIGEDVIQVNGGPKFNLTVIRTIQESIGNILKHSGAHTVTIRVLKENEAVRFIIKDDGKGIKDDNAEKRGYGLRSMAKRIKSLGGSFEIRSEENAGTEISFSIPIRNSPENTPVRV